MTDKEIIQGLIDRDNKVTEEFFFVKCRPLFCSIIREVFNCEVDYNEFVNELYLFIMKDDARKLRNFEYRSSICQWLKIVAIRYFVDKRTRMIEKNSQETPYDEHTDEIATETDHSFACEDLQRLFSLMPNKRYVDVIQKLIIEEVPPEQLAKEMNIKTTNLYNIKRRAMEQLTRVALNDIREYKG